MFATQNSQLDLFGLVGRWLVGEVVTDKDPENRDRIKVKIPELYDPDSGEIPWCGPFTFSPFGCGEGFGVYGTPKIGAKVLILLQDGDPNYPMYMSLQTPNSDFASGECWGFVDRYGNKLRVDESTWLFKNHDGSEVKFSDGNVEYKIPKKLKFTAETVEFDCKSMSAKVEEQITLSSKNTSFSTKEKFTIATNGIEANADSLKCDIKNVSLNSEKILVNARDNFSVRTNNFYANATYLFNISSGTLRLGGTAACAIDTGLFFVDATKTIINSSTEVNKDVNLLENLYVKNSITNGAISLTSHHHIYEGKPTGGPV